ncbi:MAG: arginine--tRNA ligase [Acidobacteria bacterium]|nr:arginine--tRNA ligase [Acidobacteriota bacterium]
MYRAFQQRLAMQMAAFLRAQYGAELPQLVVEQPPRVELGEYALPLSFELAKKLRRAPKQIAQEIIGGIGAVAGFEKLEVAGAGYINARVKRAEFAEALAQAKGTTEGEAPEALGEKMLVEHTSINPNKAAHIGHLRNAILGDTYVRLLRAAGRQVAVQNYIDNTGVQVADVVVGLELLEGKSLTEVAEMIARDPRFDYTCWDLYTRVSQWYEQDQKNTEARLATLHRIEAGGNPTAEMADLVSTYIVGRHLQSMERLGIQYDFLPRESEILRLKFWDAAFAQLKQRGVLRLEAQGKNAGCWVMQRGKASTAENAENAEENQKVIVRSNGTVTYVGKDIAYHLWKFGLLGRDFGYRRFYRYADGHQCWMSAEAGESEHPNFGGVAAIYNVIDSRQTDPQNNVIEALRALGYTQQAARYTHFSYEMVALTPRCAEDLGYSLSEEARSRAYIEVSGRKGFGVKADDLMDALIHKAQQEVDSRHSELEEGARTRIATQIALGALRYFMLRFTKGSVIAFDFTDALSFEGETGPYAQYAVVRATNIFRKAGVEPEAALAGPVDYERFLSGDAGTEIWELWLDAAKLSFVVEQAIATTEPAFVAKHAFQLAQSFNNFYHRHHILHESDQERKKFLMATAAAVRRELMRTLEVLGIECPPVM